MFIGSTAIDKTLKQLHDRQHIFPNKHAVRVVLNCNYNN